MNAFSLQRVEICGQRRYQGLTFTGFHLSDPALMKSDTADNLYVEMFHPQYAEGRFPADRKSLRQKTV